MAIPFNDLDAAVNDRYLPDIVNAVFLATPLWTRLYTRNNFIVGGGKDLRQPVLYGKLPGESFSGSGPFSTDYKQTHTLAQWLWKWNYVNVTIQGTDLDTADSELEIIGLLDPKMEAASLTMKDNLSTQIHGDGTGNGGKDLDGFLNALDDGSTYSSYAGLSRSDIPKWAGNLNSTGGAFSLDMLQSSYGSATDGNEEPDMIVMPQTIYNKLWARTQTQQRFVEKDLADVGFRGIKFNNADVVVDNYCPAGTIIGLNTKYVKFIVNKNANMKWTEPKSGTNEYAYIRQLLFSANLEVMAPWRCFMLQNVT
jgi:hypothetical protein